VAKKGLTAEYFFNESNHDIQCTLYRRPCKNLRIVIDADQQVKITAPLRASNSYINEVVKEKTPWIIKTIIRLQNRKVLPLPCAYISGEKTTYLGKEYTLNILAGKWSHVTLADDQLVVQSKRSNADIVKRVVDKWYREQAEKVFRDILINALPSCLTMPSLPPSLRYGI
jgi:predicted metal-dependent hydrolase